MLPVPGDLVGKGGMPARARPARILVAEPDAEVLAVYERTLGATDEEPPEGARAAPPPELVLVREGHAAIDAVARATASGGFAMAFVDLDLTAALDGLATVEHLWTLDADLQVVIASGSAVAPWQAIQRRFGATDRLLFLKKPFDPVEVRQFAMALCKKRDLLRASRQRERALELYVAERTRELARALRRAEDAAQARMRFLANMSHEIRTPLTAILGFAELLRDPAASGDQADHLEIIDRNCRHLLQLVNDVLDLSKLEAGQLLLDCSPTDVRTLVADVLSTMRQQAEAKGLRLECELAGPCPRTLHTDGMRVRQILFNLVSNAVKFTNQGEVRLRIGIDGQDADAPMLAFTVQDSGIGIAEDQLASLFVPFVQADASTSRRFGGTGLGLSICKHLARLLGGNVEARSVLGEGSSFTLVLPLGAAADGPMLTALGEERAVAAAPVDEPLRLAGRILLAEDGRDNRRLLSRILTRAGASVVAVGDGAEAVAAVQAAAAGQPFDLVLMDMQMPVMDGYEATRTLRAQGFARPIIALTAHAMEGDRDRCFAEGCDGYETKPVRAERLVATCARFGLGVNQPRAAGPAAAR
jgi:signal transduction histidine kinase